MITKSAATIKATYLSIVKDTIDHTKDVTVMAICDRQTSYDRSTSNVARACVGLDMSEFLKILLEVYSNGTD